MFVAGVGTEIVECLRIARMIEVHEEKFLRQVFTRREIEYCNSRKFKTQHFAARWAGKKAVMMAIASTVPPNEMWCDIEIRPQQGGQTPVALGGIARQICLAQGIDRVLASISYCRQYATGYAIAIASGDSLEAEEHSGEIAEWPTDDFEPDDDFDIPF